LPPPLAQIGDFGLAKELASESKFAYTNVGTPFYMSPEMINEMRYNEKSDIWALGCLLFELCALVPPFEATNQLNLAVKINAGKFARIPPRYSEDLYRAIRWMLQVDSTKRPAVEDLEKMPRVRAVLERGAGGGAPAPALGAPPAAAPAVAAAGGAGGAGGGAPAALAAREAELARREAEVGRREAAVGRREVDVARREAELGRREAGAPQPLVPVLKAGLGKLGAAAAAAGVAIPTVSVSLGAGMGMEADPAGL
jgi:NIMA (never in mitosis gene a)-related kinase